MQRGAQRTKEARRTTRAKSAHERFVDDELVMKSASRVVNAPSLTAAPIAEGWFHAVGW